MNRHALQVLEFPAVVEALSKHCETPAGRSLALATQPSSRPTEVREFQGLLTDAWELAGQGLPPLSGIHDVEHEVKVCQKGATIGGERIFKIGRSLGVMTAAADYLVNAKVTGRIAELGLRLPNLPKLVNEIGRCLDGDGEVLDEASIELALLRSKRAKVAKRIQTTIQGYVSGRTRELLSDPMFTTRNGRFVLPLKAENKGKIRGIVHDSSSSGQTIYLEPADVVAQGNDLREVEAKERAEVERILAHLSSQVGNSADSIVDGLAASATLDLVFAKVRYGHTGCLPTIVDHPCAELVAARHPLLDAKKVVPMNLSLSGEVDTILITGPNTGGKTVAIKCLGLCVAMCQSGMPVPAHEAKLGVFNQIWADIGDEQSMAQSLSTFSGHVKNVAEALKGCGPGSLVLLDEIGAGTDPGEGAALATACLDEFQRKGAKTMASTHYGELKVFAANRKGFMNASMEFDAKSLAPTYKLIQGTPGSSQALKIAARYGIPDSVIESATQGISVGEQDIAKMIEKLEVSQRLATKAQSEADRLAARLKHVEAEVETKLKEAEQAKQKVRTRAAEELEEVLRLIRLEATDAFESIKRDPSQSNLEKARKRLRDVQEVGSQFVREMRPSSQPSRELAAATPVAVGAHVMVEGIGQRGVVLAVKGKDSTVQIGSMRMQVPNHRLTEVQNKPVRSTATRQSLDKAFSMKQEVSLRELRAEVAKDTLEQFLDDALLAGLDQIRIVHGKGEGILKKVTEQILRANPQVKSFREGSAEEGGFGVTIAKLK